MNAAVRLGTAPAANSRPLGRGLPFRDHTGTASCCKCVNVNTTDATTGATALFNARSEYTHV
jgi:hypothetical protein